LSNRNNLIAMKYYLLCVFIIIFLNQSRSQICVPGTPYTFTDSCSPSIGMAVIPSAIMAQVDNDSLILRDSIQGMNGVYRFGEVLDVNLDMIVLGRWDTLPDGSRLCRFNVISTGAWSIYFQYDDFWLPPQANLYIYGENSSRAIGAFTEQNNTLNGIFATQLVAGDTITLEYREPANCIQSARINISKVIHDYRNFIGLSDGPHGNALSCHVNVSCPAGNAWRNEIRSVGLVLLAGGSCSGTLLNNVQQNGVPYFLTAFHCIDSDGDGIISSSEQSSAENMIVHFNHEAGRCGDNTWHDLHTVSGSTYLSGSPNSDFALFQLNTTPPSQYGVHYAGWSNLDVPATSSAGFHHPGGDIKKLAIDNDVALNYPFTQGWLGSPSTPPNTHWDVTYDQGRTEGGSSGSPLFDQNHRVVGQLHGGFVITTCSTVPRKLYGKLSYSWDGDGTSATRLSDYLDPDFTGIDFLGGWDPTCVSDLTFIETINNGVTVTRKSNGTLTAGPNYVINSGGEATLIADKKIVLKQGFHAKTGSKFHALIAPVSAVCNPPVTVEIFDPGSPTLLIGFSMVMAANALHGTKPYDFTWHIDEPSSSTNVSTGTTPFHTFTPCECCQLIYSVTVTDANGVSVTSSSITLDVELFIFGCAQGGGGSNKVGNGDNNDNDLSLHEINNELSLDNIGEAVPDKTIYEGYTLSNYPNPFNDGTIIAAYIPGEFFNSEIVIYGIVGKVINRFPLKPGHNFVEVKSDDLKYGIYLYSLMSGETRIETKKMVYVK